MSQSLVAETQPRVSGADSEFEYRPLSKTALAGLVFAVSSVFAFVVVAWNVLAVAALLCSWWAIRGIRRSENAYSGVGLARASAVLAVVVLAGSSAMHAYLFATEVPEGFQRVNFTREISKKGIVFENGVNRIHPEVEALNGKKIFLKGYMYPVRQQHGLTEFVLVKDNNQCCFGGQPKQTDMIYVKLPEDRAVDYYPGLVALAGTFHTEAPALGGALKPVYQLDGEYFSHAKTTY